MKVKHSRIVVLFWLRCCTVSCSESSLCCSAEALLMTSADSVWISANMLLACRDRSDSWRRMLIKVWQFTASRSREANTSPLTSSRSLFILPRLRGSTILLWNGIFFKENIYLFVILQLVHLFFISVKCCCPFRCLNLFCKHPDIPPRDSKDPALILLEERFLKLSSGGSVIRTDSNPGIWSNMRSWSLCRTVDLTTASDKLV